MSDDPFAHVRIAIYQHLLGQTQVSLTNPQGLRLDITTPDDTLCVDIIKELGPDERYQIRFQFLNAKRSAIIIKNYLTAPSFFAPEVSVNFPGRVEYFDGSVTREEPEADPEAAKRWAQWSPSLTTLSELLDATDWQPLKPAS